MFAYVYIQTFFMKMYIYTKAYWLCVCVCVCVLHKINVLVYLVYVFTKDKIRMPKESAFLQHTARERCDVRARAEREQRNALCSNQHHRGWRWTTKMAGGNSNYWEGEVAKRYKFRSTKSLIVLCDSSRQFFVLNSLWRRFYENAVSLPR